MKTLAYVALLTLMSAPLAAATTPPDGPMAPVTAFLDAFNKGDIASITAAQRDSNLAIMDEVPPHIWLGPKAVDAWLASLDSYDKAHGRTDGAVAISRPQVLTVEGDRAYVVAPAVYTFKGKGYADARNRDDDVRAALQDRRLEDRRMDVERHRAKGRGQIALGHRVPPLKRNLKCACFQRPSVPSHRS